MDCAKTATRREEKHLGFGIFESYIRDFVAFMNKPDKNEVKHPHGTFIFSKILFYVLNLWLYDVHVNACHGNALCKISKRFVSYEKVLGIPEFVEDQFKYVFKLSSRAPEN